ncbi:MAG: PEP-CTERM sorting domain-containing protein [Cyanobacteria bacterium P01_F01_bin.3]
MKRFLIGQLLAVMVAAVAASSAKADSAVLNFTGDLTSLTATNFPDPLASGPLAIFAAVIPDINRVDVQIWIQDYTGDGTYTAAFNNNTGNKILLHSPLLERIEAQTWRAEDATENPGPSGNPAGAIEISGTPVSQRTKWLLPDDTPNGAFTVTVSGGAIDSVDYLYDLSANSGLLFSDESSNPGLANILLDEVAIAGDSNDFAAAQVFAVGSTDFLATPYGLNTQLDTTTNFGGSFGAFSPNVAGGTVGNSTIGQLLNEINNNIDEIGGSTPNISNNGRHDGDTLIGTITNPEQGDGYLADIFAATTGNLYVFNGTSDLDVAVTVTQIPEPSTLAMVGLMAAGMLTIRKRS